MASRINKAEQKLNTMVARAELSPAGKDWLIAAIDPFHDKTLPNLCGYPDQQVGASITSRIQQQVTIKKSLDLADGNWQCQIAAYPWASGLQPPGTPPLIDYKSRNGTAFTPIHSGSQEIWPITVYSASDGENIGVFETTTVDEKFGVAIPQNYTKGPFRVVGWGFEVTNTTADLYRQGTCTVYRQNTNTRDVESGIYYDVPVPGLTKIGPCSFQRFKRHPRNIAEASLLAGTKVWKAEDGCYITCVMNSSANPAGPADNVQPVILQEDYPAETSMQTDTCAMLANNFWLSPAIVIPSPPLSNPVGVATPVGSFGMIPYHMSGAIFSGLSDQTTLTLTVNWYIERFPTPSELDLVVLCKPSATFDPFAMEFYDRMLSDMPVGVPVGENAFGDWFNGVVNSLSRYVAPIARSFGGPLGNTIAGIADSVNSTSGQMLQEQRTRKKKKKIRAQAQFATTPGPSVRNVPNMRKRATKALPPPTRR